MPESFGSDPFDQATAVPYRWRDDSVEFCLITSIRKKRWGFPKGIIDPGETFEETALKEAEEEAGLRGRIVGEPLGEYQYTKWGTVLRVVAVLMEATHEEAVWQEADVRCRRWVSSRVAGELLNRRELKGLLRVAVQRFQGEEA